MVSFSALLVFCSGDPRGFADGNRWLHPGGIEMTVMWFSGDMVLGPDSQNFAEMKRLGLVKGALQIPPSTEDSATLMCS